MWKMPLEKIDPTITEFQIRIRNNLGENIELANFCDGKNQMTRVPQPCLIPMTKVTSLTNLTIGSLIQVQVQAMNKYCAGPLSQPNTLGQVTEGCPIKMRPVTYKPQEITQNKITVHWSTLAGKEAGGVGVKITQFEIRMKEQADGQDYEKKNRWKTENLEFT